MKNLVCFFLCGALILLSACSHKNPLEKSSLSRSGKFLYQAGLFSEKTLNGGQNHDGKDYENCVENENMNYTVYCQQLYQQMLIFSKNNENYHDLTIEDLQDTNIYFQVRSYYTNEILLNADKLK